MSTGFNRHRERPQEQKVVTEEKKTDTVLEIVKDVFPEAEIVVIEEKPVIKAEIKKTVERKPAKRKIIVPSPTPVSEAEAVYKPSGLALNGNMQEARDFRAICKRKGWVIQDILLKFIKEFNAKNYTF